MRIAATALAIALLLTGCVPTSPAPPPPTPEELAELDRLVLDMQWGVLQFTPDAPRPTVDMIEYVDYDSIDSVYDECLTEQGYEDYAYGGSPAREAEVDERLALYTCMAKYPLRAWTYGLFTERQLGYLYDYYRDSLVPCLRGAGVDIGPVPTRAEFVVEPTAFAYTWSPYSGSFGLTRTEYTSLYVQCPDLSYQLFETGE